MLAKFSVKKPYTIAVAILLILILGFVSYSHMTLDLMPSINLPYAVISTSYVGASPEEVEQTVTKPIEQRMASVNNIKSIQSISSEHLSMVILEFQQIVAVIQRVDVFGFAGVDEFLRHDQFLLKDMHRLGQLRQECGFLMDMWTQTSSD